ncbi:MAG: hypothetical protein AABX01_00105 [Candidatus Micrarchaeota archaeon]
MNETKIMLGILLLLLAMVFAADPVVTGSGGGSSLGAVPTYKVYSGGGSYALGIGESVNTGNGYLIKLTGMSSIWDSALYAVFDVYEAGTYNTERSKVSYGDTLVLADGKIKLKLEGVSVSSDISKAKVTLRLEEATSGSGIGGGSSGSSSGSWAIGGGGTPTSTASGGSGSGSSGNSVPTSTGSGSGYGSASTKPSSGGGTGSGQTNPSSGSSGGAGGIAIAIRPIMVTVEPGELPPSPPSEDLPIEGAKYTIDLRSGWNLISFPYFYQYDYQCRGEICPAQAEEGVEMPLLYRPPALKIIENTCDSSTLWHYNGYSKAYDKYEMDSFAPVSELNGFWMKAGSNCRITIAGNNELNWQGMELVAGWNHLGGPSKNTLFEKMKGSCDVSSGPWKYNAAANKYEKVEVLKPGEGYFVKVSGNCNLGAYTDDDFPPLPDDETIVTPAPTSTWVPTYIPTSTPKVYPVRPTKILNKETIVLSKGETKTVFGTAITLEEIGSGWVQIKPVLGNVRTNDNPGMKPEGIPWVYSGNSVKINLNEEAALVELYDIFKPTQISDNQATIDVYFKASSVAKIVLHRTMRKCSDGSPILDEYGRAEQMFTVGDSSGYWNYDCGSRNQEQCIEDGSFDQYYDEWCESVN